MQLFLDFEIKRIVRESKDAFVVFSKIYVIIIIYKRNYVQNVDTTMQLQPLLYRKLELLNEDSAYFKLQSDMPNSLRPIFLCPLYGKQYSFLSEVSTY